MAGPARSELEAAEAAPESEAREGVDPSPAEDLLELIMRRYERASTMITSNWPVDDWGRLLGDTAAVGRFWPVDVWPV